MRARDYAYDAEGRLCATQTLPYSGGVIAYGYIYDAEGRRVAKGTINTVPTGQYPSCNLATNGFALTESYVLGQGGERLTSTAWNGGTSTWQNTNVYEAGKLIATYDTTTSGLSQDAGVAGGLHFQLTDPLGTRRVQTNSVGEAELDCQSLPFGDQLSCFPDPNAPDDAQDEDSTGSLTGIHFTGKERDAESGLDYFGARYYGSNMGRFLSPDWSADPVPVPYANLSDPQSLNLYSYARNNPLIRIDKDGHCWSWLQGACNAFEQAYHGLFTDYGFKTNAQVSQVNEQNRQWLIRNNVVTPDKNGNTIDWNKASGSQVRGAYSAAAGAMILRLIHGPETISGAAMDSVRKMSTEDIIESLKNGDQPGIIKPDGTVMNGNTRLSVLQERGVDINSLGLKPDSMYGEFSAAEGAAAQQGMGSEGLPAAEPVAGPPSADPEEPE
jgi:RHS repeat-associated protein